LKYSKSGEYLSTACADNSIHVISSNGMEVILRGHESGVNDVVWLDDSGQYLATCSDDFTIRIWDIEKEVCINVLTGHEDFVFCLDKHPFQNILISGSYDEKVKVWDSRSNNYCIHSIPAHSSPVTSVCFDNTGLEFISAGTDGQTRLWNTRDGYCRKTFGLATGVATFPPVSSAYFSPNSKYVLTSTLDDTHRLWALHGAPSPGPQTATGPTLRGKGGHMPAARDDVSGSGSVGADQRPPSVQGPVVVREFKGHTNRTNGISSQLVNIDSRQYLVSGSEDCKVYIWDVASSKLVQTLGDHQDSVLCVAYDPVGQVLASAGNNKDPAVRLWALSLRPDE